MYPSSFSCCGQWLVPSKHQGQQLQDICQTNCWVCIYYLATPHTEKNIQKVVSVQRKVACYVVSDLECNGSITNILKILEWQSLEQCRAQAQVMMYEIAHNVVNINPFVYLQQAVVRGSSSLYQERENQHSNTAFALELPDCGIGSPVTWLSC